MEGLNGFKILSESISNEPTPLGIIIAALSLAAIICGITLFIISFDVPKQLPKKRKKRRIASILLIILGIIAMIKVPTYEIHFYQITSTSDQYSIDLDMYQITGSENEIITIQRR